MMHTAETVCFFFSEAFVPVIGGLVVWEILLVIGSVLATVVMLTTSTRQPPRFFVVRHSFA